MRCLAICHCDSWLGKVSMCNSLNFLILRVVGGGGLLGVYVLVEVYKNFIWCG